MSLNEILRNSANKGISTIKGSLFGDEEKGNFVGEIGKRAEFVLKCMEIVILQQGYFVKIYKFEDEAGNVVVNFASKDLSWVGIGEKYRIRATVKRQVLYQFVRQTQIIRLKKIELFYEPQTENTSTRSDWMSI